MDNTIKKKLSDTIDALLAGNKGLLAMDESLPTANKRFAQQGIAQTVEMRRAYRELIVTNPGLGEYISGAILFDETIRQSTKDGRPFVDVLTKAGIVPGIKVDMGAVDMANFVGEKITEGLDGLRERLAEYAKLGARFAKWRAVLTIIEPAGPSKGCLDANMNTLARYAALCQEVGIVPIVEPEVLMDGDHTLEECYQVTERALRMMFSRMFMQRVDIKYLILKSNMILPGTECADQSNLQDIARLTVSCFLRTVPAIVPGIVFLSGGQTSELATERLNEMNAKYKAKMPWALSFSFSRALQDEALKIWNGKDENVVAAQKELYHRAKLNNAARAGVYTREMENNEGAKAASKK